MRITTLQTSNTMLDYMTSAESRYYDLAEESSSGYKVNKPSDDAVATKSLLKIKEQLSELNNYSSNMKTSQSELATVSSTLDSVTTMISKVSDYATQAANGTYNNGDISDIKSQIDSITSSLVDLSNTQFNGTYVFSGTATSSPTYSVAANGDITYGGTITSEYQRYVTISDGVSVPINAKGSDVFGSYTTAAPVVTPTGGGDVAGTTIAFNADGTTTVVNTTISGGNTTRTTSTGTGLFGTMKTLSSALSTNNTTAINSSITRLSTDLNTVTSTATSLAGVDNRMDMTQNSIDNTVTNLKSYRSDLRDADVTEVMTALSQAQYALQATYSVTTKMLSSTSLLDYIK